MRPLAPLAATYLLLALAAGPALAAPSALTAGPAAPAARAALLDSTTIEVLLARADRQFRAGVPDSVLATVAPLLAQAVSGGDERLELRARLHQAGAEALSGRLREAERTARRAGDLATKLAAPAAGRMAQRWLGYSLLGQGRTSESIAVYTALRDAARAAGDQREEAYALMGLAYQALGRGEAAAARVDYERAAGLFAAAGEAAIALDAQVGLARSLGAEGRYRDMRRLYERILAEGERAGQARVVGYALNNLGSYEYQAGDPGRAVDYWERAIAAKRKAADPVALITPTVNLALARMSLGAFDDARATLLEMLERCRAGGYREQEAQVLEQLANFERAHGRRAEARTLWRQILDLGAAAAGDGLEAGVEIAASLAAEGRGDEAARLADSLAVAQPRDPDSYLMARLHQARAAAYAAQGRHEAALAAAGDARARFRAGGFAADELSVLVAAAASERALAGVDPARADSAIAHLQQARQLWEAVRAVPRDPQWRERRGTLGTAIHMDLAAAFLARAPAGDAGATQAAFDVLQGYKARTLLERRLGPDAYTSGDRARDADVTLERLQHEVLRPGELLLDYYLGEQASLVFAVTDSTCRVATLPPARALRGLASLFLDLVASPGAAEGPGEAYAPAAERLAREILVPCAPELSGARTVLISADGLLNRLPFELLPLPGSAGAGPGVGLGAIREVSRVPSAGVLAQLRVVPVGGAAQPAVGPRGLVLLTDELTAKGRALEGAEQEARRIERAYRDVRALAATQEVADGRWLDAAAGAAVLHVPAHSEAFDQRPWNSRIRVGTDAEGRPRWLVSADIAAAPLGVPLAVLSGCSSAGGQALSGEGMLGLTGAFLAAGSQAVVASLWDVDDGATALFMDRFYRELADGRTVAGALAAARRALAAAPATAAPRHWAAFVVVGDGNLAVPLQRRAPAAPAAAGGLAALAALAVLAGLAARSQRRRRNRTAAVIPGPDGTLS